MHRRSLVASVVTAAMVAVLGVTSAAAAAVVTTSERVYLPPGGAVTIAGHGFGHGRGLSQWGARGAATQGVGYQEILDFYYPGTTRVTQNNAEIRVLVSADDDNEVRVVAQDGMTASDTRNTRRPIGFPGETVTQWRIVRQAEGLFLHGLVNGAWRPWSQGASSSFLGIEAPSGTVRLLLPNGTSKLYRGSVRAVEDGAAPRLRTVNALPMESYLRSVVPSESPSSWPADALRAQAVAARTYASFDRAARPSAPWHTCDTTSCQVYPGYRTYNSAGVVTTTHEASTTDAAIAGTANQVRYFGGAPAFTQFSSSNGGWTASGSLAYQVAKPDPWDAIGNPVHSWSLRVTTERLRTAYPQVGTPRYVETSRRTGDGEWGGRVVDVVIAGSSGSVTVSGSAFRSALGLRSDWWKLTGSTRLDSDTTADGRPDLVAVMNDGSLRSYEGTGDGGFAGWRQVGKGWSGMRLVVRANDLTSDGRTDVLAVDQTGVLWRYEPDGKGGFGSATKVGPGWGGFRMIVMPGDIDGDGAVDMLAIDSGGVMWQYPGRGDGSFQSRFRVGPGWGGMTAVLGGGDWTGDGRVDFVARAADGRLFLYQGGVNGGFSGRQIGTGWSGMRLLTVVDDWDGDTRPDVLASGSDGALRIYPWLGDRFGSPRVIGSAWDVVRVLS
ncbi:SpoIID/LytB domain-containing protein [Cellulosimicrobium cellulans]|uniref:SpoIID/LytB domain-containing protein n=1 Tax=Cellulosimicrobium cellulans TaxID=1710 RepID=UPI000687B3A8|nr:SpoIID/LytB domain-containing protein [Cellulosimicrobium cellulans]